MTINLTQIQNTIGYEFNNEDLLQQAFVRRSYSEEHGGQNNEVLEFIGDKSLDFAVIRIMMERFGKITDDKDFREFKLKNPKYFKTKLKEGKFTDIKKDLVKKGALSDAMDNLGFNSQLIMGEGDKLNNIQNQPSVKEDLFEAIIGAVTVDCDWDMDTITDVVATMIDFDGYFENENLDENSNYVGLVQEWMQKNGYGIPDYQYYENEDCFECSLDIDDLGYFEGKGLSRAKARMDCAENVYNFLKDEGYILNKYKEAVGDPDEYESLKQINELVQKGLISKPEYKFNQFHDEEGNSIWECECIVEGNDNTFINSATSKKEAQRMSAYEMLLDLMGEYYEDD